MIDILRGVIVIFTLVPIRSFMLQHVRHNLLQNNIFQTRESLVLCARRRTKISRKNRNDAGVQQSEQSQNIENVIDSESAKLDTTIPEPIRKSESEPETFANKGKTVVFQRGGGLLKELEEDIENFKIDTVKEEKNLPALELPSSFDLDFDKEFISSRTKKNNDDNDIIIKLKELLSGILIADFFAIIFFLLWFIAASIAKEGFHNAYLLERFQDIFQPIIQPALGLLMAGSVLSGVIKTDGDDEKE